jgi:iron(III) transport system substrate-binding protein
MYRSTLKNAVAFLVPLALAACAKDADVTLYVALDQEHSQQLVKQFEQQSGLRVNARFDTEASKTIGLVTAIIEEAPRPRCDVFWNNELAHTVRLAQKGLLESYASPSAAAIPAEFRDAAQRFTGFAARARVFIVNTQKMPDRAAWPSSLWDLIDPRFRGRCAIARPLTGTTLTHFTALRHVLSEADFTRFMDGLFANEVRFLQSNGATMRAVRDGELDFALTDTDDFHVAFDKGFPVGCVFPDQGDGQIGTMLIPNSVGIIKGGPHPEAARRLVDFVLSEQVEALLAASKSAQIPVRSSVAPPKCGEVLPIGTFRAMRWDPERTAAALEESLRDFAQRFGG